MFGSLLQFLGEDEPVAIEPLPDFRPLMPLMVLALVVFVWAVFLPEPFNFWTAAGTAIVVAVAVMLRLFR